MKRLILITLSFAYTAVCAADLANDCDRCGAVTRLINEMNVTPSNPANKTTRKEQDRLFDRATDMIPSLLKRKIINLATARAILTLIAKANGYSNDGTLGEDNSQSFSRHWNSSDGIFQKAANQLVHDQVITAAEKQQMLEEMGVIDSPGAPNPRAPQSLSKKSK